MPLSESESARKRKRMKASPSMSTAPPLWKTDQEQKKYSTKLLDALRRVRPDAAAAAPRTRAVRLAADRALAVAAKGRTRWSRAIIAGRPVKLKAVRRRPVGPRRSKEASGSGLGEGKKRELVPPLERRAKVLGRLVPGCRKVGFPTLLEETSDYIAALQMQVRAMSALTLALSAAGGDTARQAAAPEPPQEEESI